MGRSDIQPNKTVVQFDPTLSVKLNEFKDAKKISSEIIDSGSKLFGLLSAEEETKVCYLQLFTYEIESARSCSCLLGVHFYKS